MESYFGVVVKTSDYELGDCEFYFALGIEPWASHSPMTDLGSVALSALRRKQ